jgi:hypothetical protein
MMREAKKAIAQSKDMQELGEEWKRNLESLALFRTMTERQADSFVIAEGYGKKLASAILKLAEYSMKGTGAEFSIEQYDDALFDETLFKPFEVINASTSETLRERNDRLQNTLPQDAYKDLSRSHAERIAYNRVNAIVSLRSHF